MPALIAKFVSRANIVKLKRSGGIPQLSWTDVGRMLITPNRNWPTYKLAVPQDDCQEERFDTPIGLICCDSSYRSSLGLLVFEELCAIYEQGEVGIREGDIVLDLGAHIGTFTRFALNRGAAKVIAFEP